MRRPHTPRLEIPLLMQLGMIGLGRMGANMVRRLIKNGHQCVVFDANPQAVKQLAGEGAVGTNSLADFASKLTAFMHLLVQPYY